MKESIFIRNRRANEYYMYRREGLSGRMFYLTKRMAHRAKILLKSDRKRERLLQPAV